MPLIICCAQWLRLHVATSAWSAFGPAPTMRSPRSVVNARISTDQHATETILSRALIGFFNPREELSHVWQFFQTHDCSMNFGFSCGSRSDQLSTADH